MQKPVRLQRALKRARYPVLAARIRRNILRHFEAARQRAPGVVVAATSEPEEWSGMRLERHGAVVHAALKLEAFKRHSHAMKHRTSAMIHWFAQAPAEVTGALFDISDGDWSAGARFSYSSNSAEVIALPDQRFFDARGYAEDDIAARDAPDWAARSDDIVWRGQTNNNGLFSVDPAMVHHMGVKQRLRLAVLSRDMAGVDFKFVANRHSAQANTLIRAGLTAGRVPPETWFRSRYAIDIDGFTNAWDNFLRRLKMGCCVLKVESPFGFRQWYYDRLRPFEHYVPVRADLTDFAEQVAWVRANPTRAAEIAAAGQAVAAAMTTESETAVAADLITRHWRG